MANVKRNIKIEIKSYTDTPRLRSIFINGTEVTYNTEGSDYAALQKALPEIIEALKSLEGI